MPVYRDLPAWLAGPGNKWLALATPGVMCDSTRDSVLAKETEPTYLFPTPHYFKKLRHATVAGWWVWHLQGRQAGLRPRGVGGAVSSLKAVLRQNSLFLFRRNINLFFFFLNLRPSADWMRPTFSFFFFFLNYLFGCIRSKLWHSGFSLVMAEIVPQHVGS